MNRHERRKQKKNNKLNQSVNQDLLQGIELHTNKKYKEAEILYNKVLSSEPKNYEALRHLGILNQDLEDYEKAYNYFLQIVNKYDNSDFFKKLETQYNQNVVRLNEKSKKE